jgi:glutamine synthetase
MGNIPRLLIQSDFEKIPMWSNGSTVLKPVKLYLKGDRYIVMCELLDTNNKSIPTDYRGELSCLCAKSKKLPISVKQELVFTNANKDRLLDTCDVKTYGENIIEEFVKVCLSMSITIDGVNQEDFLGKWSYQLSSGDVLSIADDLWVSRFVLHKLCNRDKEEVVFETQNTPVPLKMYVDCNGKLLVYNQNNNPYKMLTEVF